MMSKTLKNVRPTLASQSRFDPNWAVAQDLELELKSKLEPKLES